MSIAKSNVLIADSNPALVDVLCESFEELGHAAEGATGGIQCLTKLRRGRFDIVVLDANLPWGGSEGVLTVMCQDRRLRRVPVVLTHRDRLPNCGDRALELIVDTIRKPYWWAPLYSAVDSALEFGASMLNSRRRGDRPPAVHGDLHDSSQSLRETICDRSAR